MWLRRVDGGCLSNDALALPARPPAPENRTRNAKHIEPCKNRSQFYRHSLHAVELSQWCGKPCANCVCPSRPHQWGPDCRFWASWPCRPAGWLAMLFIKAGNVETNPGPTTTRKQVWICDICHRQIQVRKEISIRCNRIEHWVHLRCASIRLAQYTDTWTCHQHRES